MRPQSGDLVDLYRHYQLDTEVRHPFDILFAPELQWKSRGKCISQGGVRWSVCPVDTGCVPLSYGGNPGVHGVSHRGVRPVKGYIMYSMI